MKIVSTLIILLLFSPLLLLAQTISITGRIVDERLDFVADAQIESPDTTFLNVTDFKNGEFKIEVHEQYKATSYSCSRL